MKKDHLYLIYYCINIIKDNNMKIKLFISTYLYEVLCTYMGVMGLFWFLWHGNVIVSTWTKPALLSIATKKKKKQKQNRRNLKPEKTF